MSKMPDRKSLRREYLRQKGEVYGEGAIYAVLFVPALLIAVFAVVCGVTGLGGGNNIFTGLIGVAMFGSISAYCWLQMRDARRRTDAVPYAPPIQPDTLPAEEILVRAADEPPVVQSEVLLRAAQEHETPKEELLRGPVEYRP